MALRAAFLGRAENRWCPVMLKLKGIQVRANQIHHVRGRIGPLLCATEHWLAVSAEGHFWIGAHPIAARENGWLCASGDWNKTR